MDKKTEIEKFHKERILICAEALFSENGIEAATMDQLAQAAGYSKTTVYKYFTSKQEIQNILTYQSFVTLKERFEAILQEKTDFFDSYLSICQSLVEFHDEYPLYFNALLATIDVDTEDAVLRDIYDIGEDINNLLQTALEKGIEEELLSTDIQFPEILLLLWSSIVGIINMSNQKERYIEKRMKMSKTEFRNYGFKMLLQGLI